MGKDYNFDRMMDVDPGIGYVLDNCVRVSRMRGEWVAAEIYQKAADEIRKRDEKIDYLLEELRITKLQLLDFDLGE